MFFSTYWLIFIGGKLRKQFQTLWGLASPFVIFLLTLDLMPEKWQNLSTISTNLYISSALEVRSSNIVVWLLLSCSASFFSLNSQSLDWFFRCYQMAFIILYIGWVAFRWQMKIIRHQKLSSCPPYIWNALLHAFSPVEIIWLHFFSHTVLWFMTMSVLLFMSLVSWQGVMHFVLL